MIVDEPSGSRDVDPEYHLDLVVAIVDRAIKDWLRDPLRYGDALDFVRLMAGGRLIDTGGKRITSAEELGRALKRIYQRNGEAA